ncbi:MAG: GIY-YIG nuclease family protein, partial [Caulobacteraceae bacterium]
MTELNDRELLEELGVEVEGKKGATRTPREERIVAGFEDILKFVDEHGRPPRHGEDRDIFERLYATRLDRIRAQADCRELVGRLDTHGLLSDAAGVEETGAPFIDDAALLADLGVAPAPQDDITKLTHVKSREEIRATEEIATRERCEDFAAFEPLFEAVRKDLEAGVREARRFGENAA